jgi:hypothetical protein
MAPSWIASEISFILSFPTGLLIILEVNKKANTKAAAPINGAKMIYFSMFIPLL